MRTSFKGRRVPAKHAKRREKKPENKISLSFCLFPFACFAGNSSCPGARKRLTAHAPGDGIGPKNGSPANCASNSRNASSRVPPGACSNVV